MAFPLLASSPATALATSTPPTTQLLRSPPQDTIELAHSDTGLPGGGDYDDDDLSDAQIASLLDEASARLRLKAAGTGADPLHSSTTPTPPPSSISYAPPPRYPHLGLSR